MSGKQQPSPTRHTLAPPALLTTSEPDSHNQIPIFTPESPRSQVSEHPVQSVRPELNLAKVVMDQAREAVKPGDVSLDKTAEPSAGVEDAAAAENAAAAAASGQKKVTSNGKCKHGAKHRKTAKKHKHKRKEESDSSSSSSSSSSESESEDVSTPSDSEDSSSEDEKQRKKKAKKLAKRKKAKKRAMKLAKSKRQDSSSDESSASDSESESESEPDRRRRRRSRRTRAAERQSSDEDDAVDDAADDESGEGEDDTTSKLEALQQLLQSQSSSKSKRRRKESTNESNTAILEALNEILEDSKSKVKSKASKRRKKKSKKAKKASTLEFKRVDQLWDSNIHDYKLTESADAPVDEFDEYIFTVRRKFDWENKYRNTVVDIKSKILRDVLAEVMKDVKGVSLVEEAPSIDPNMLFLYLEEIRTHYKKTLKSRLKKERKSKNKRKMKAAISQCKLLVSYLDEDYAATKKTLYPMIEAGNITFDLLWALFKPNEIIYTSTYGNWDEPRCFKVDFANKESSFVKGEWYCIEGRYLEYDGKSFGLGDFEVNVDSFKGPRKITSLAAYPLSYHKDPESVKTSLVERGKKFVALAGMKYRFHKGMAFHKKKNTVFKFNINGRVMIDPAIFRRMLPNYPISLIKPKDADDLLSDDGSSSCCGGSDADNDGCRAPRNDEDAEETEAPTTKFKLVRDAEGEFQIVQVPVDEDGAEIRPEKLDKLGSEEASDRTFTEEELLLASSVVLGFSFGEKQWLEFTLSGVSDIVWNEGAFESLVVPEDRKSIVKALVSAHKFKASETIDDVVQGKGKGLVFVLHGPPGVGKTLTGEGIAEYLKCPLYAVSAGELGTDSQRLETELQKIMDIAHSWGAVLLLDEADVFLEKRQVQDVHRNAMVSIFLRLLEYFQGILFLTTNRVDTFDDAFQSRIHLPLRYEDLSYKAKQEIWRMFIGRVRDLETSVAAAASSSNGAPSENATAVVSSNPVIQADGKLPIPKIDPFTEDDLRTLAKHMLNGRQIKNTVRTAQAIAVHEGVQLNMEHIKRVLEVAESFDRDLKGGTGYLDAMRSYT